MGCDSLWFDLFEGTVTRSKAVAEKNKNKVGTGGGAEVTETLYLDTKLFFITQSRDMKDLLRPLPVITFGNWVVDDN